MWVPNDPETLAKIASVKSGNLNSMGDLTTTGEEFSKQLAWGATVVGGGALVGTVRGAVWASEAGWLAFGTSALSVGVNPNPTAFDYLTLGVGARAQWIDHIAPEASFIHQGVGLVLDGMGKSFEQMSSTGYR